jgi:aspartate/methionine/tyrosine aminotransferase
VFQRTRYLEWAARHYGKVRFDLATSGMPAFALEALGIPEAQHLNDPAGWTRLRQAIAKYNDVPEDECVSALGTTHALWLAFASLTSPGDEVLIETPAYEPLLRIAEGVGAHVRTFGREPSERFRLDPERVAREIGARTRVVAVTNLHNPSGVRASDRDLRETARVAGACGATLLVDEVYAPFDALVDARGVFHGSARKLAPNVVAVSSLTKCYGLGHHRIGWLLGPSPIAARAADATTASCGALPLLHAHAAICALQHVARIADAARPKLGRKRIRVGDWVREQGLSWSTPMEGLFAFVEVPGAGDLTSFVEAALREREVLVAPGAFFGLPSGFRLAWSVPPDVLEEGLGRLAEALTALRDTRGALQRSPLPPE